MDCLSFHFNSLKVTNLSHIPLCAMFAELILKTLPYEHFRILTVDLFAVGGLTLTLFIYSVRYGHCMQS